MNVENLVKYKLLNTPEVTQVVKKTEEGLPLIEVNKNPVGKFPSITLQIEEGRDDRFADDKTYSIYEVIKINFYCLNDEYFLVKEAINKAMQEINLFRFNYYSVTNESTGVTHFTVLYRASLTTAMLKKQYTEQYMQLETPEQTLPPGEYFDPETGGDIIIDEEDIDPDLFWP